jgi:uncharacterized protein YecT (DUF1311 family)
MMKYLAGALALLLYTGGALAIDNPDAPDLLGEFRSQSALYEQRVDEAAGGNASGELGAQAAFLDAELNRAYRTLMARLPEPQKKALRESQRVWLRHRDAEAAFTAQLWTREDFGTSANLSRGQHQARLVRDRVEMLLGVLQSLPSD